MVNVVGVPTRQIAVCLASVNESFASVDILARRRRWAAIGHYRASRPRPHFPDVCSGFFEIGNKNFRSLNRKHFFHRLDPYYILCVFSLKLNAECVAYKQKR